MANNYNTAKNETQNQHIIKQKNPLYHNSSVFVRIYTSKNYIVQAKRIETGIKGTKLPD
jgi:hypothetical protein